MKPTREILIVALVLVVGMWIGYQMAVTAVRPVTTTAYVPIHAAPDAPSAPAGSFGDGTFALNKDIMPGNVSIIDPGPHLLLGNAYVGLVAAPARSSLTRSLKGILSLQVREGRRRHAREGRRA